MAAPKTITEIFKKPKVPALPEPQVPAVPAPNTKTDTGAKVVIGADATKNKRVSGGTGNAIASLGSGGLSI